MCSLGDQDADKHQCFWWEQGIAPAKGSAPFADPGLWRFGLGPHNFFHFPPQGSEDLIPVKLALMAEKPKLHKANFLSYDLSNTRLLPPNRNFACLYKPAILQPKDFSPSRAFQLRSTTRLRQQEHHIRATCSSRKSDHFPNACGFRWWHEIWVSHQSSPCQRLRNVITSPSCGCYSFIFADSRCIPSCSRSLLHNTEQWEGEDAFQTPQNYQLVPEIEKLCDYVAGRLTSVSA